MSVEHMRTSDTLARNIEMCYLVECGQRIPQVAARYKIRPSSARASVKRLRGHLKKFIGTFPKKLQGSDPRRNAYTSFAQHVGVSVTLERKSNKVGAQRDLF